MKHANEPLLSSATPATSAVEGLNIQQAESPEQIGAARELFLEYAQSLNFSLCFQSFEKSLPNCPATMRRRRGDCC